MSSFHKPELLDSTDFSSRRAGEVTTERELGDAAQWKLIQKNTFTRWTNEHLKVSIDLLDEITSKVYYTKIE